MNLSGTQLKDTYGNLLTIGTSAGSPTTGTLQNGDGQDITSLSIDGSTRINDSEFFIADNNTSTTAKLSMDIDTTNGARIRTTVNGATDIQPLGIYTGSTLRQKFETNGDISFRDTSNNEAFYWDADVARLGIGTTSPTLRLDVRGTQGSPASSGTSQIGSLSIRGTGSHFISSGMLNVSPWTGWFQSQNANDLSINYPLALNPNGGNVGIGTTSPDSILDIAGTTPTLTINDTQSKSWSVGDELGGISWRTNDGSGAGAREVGFIHIEDDEVGTNTTMSGAMVFGSSAYNASATERMRIDSSGNVGIGVSPTGKLDINVGTDARGYFADNIGEVGSGNFALQVVNSAGSALKPLGFRAEDIRFATGSSERLRIDSSGNVGIGVSPAEKLDIVADSVSGLKIGTNSEGGATLTTYQGSTNSNVRQFEINCQNFEVNTGSPTGTSTSNAFLIDSSGNVGIGTGSIDSSDGRLKLSAPSGNGNTSSIALYGNNGGAFGGSNVARSKIDTVTDGTAYGANMRFYTNDTSNVYQERLRIDSNGTVLVGKDVDGLATVGTSLFSSGTAYHTVNGGIVQYLNRTTSDGSILEFRKDNSTVGSIGTGGGSLDVYSSGASSVGLRFAQAVIPMLNGSVDDGNVDLGTSTRKYKDLYLGGNVILSSGQGIDFSDTADATGMTSELLDDYEEGTWTPTFASTTGSFTTMTMDVVTATYTKIGRQVVAKCFIRTDNVNTTGASGSLIVDGLPFNSAAGVDGYSAVSVGFVRNFVNAVESGYVEGGADHIVLQKNVTSSTAVPTDLTAGATDNQNNLMVTATYFV